MESVVLCDRASLAALSAVSLPGMPTWAGTHTIVTALPLSSMSLLFWSI